jgi:two-component system sensor histidine kinase ChiS
MTPGQELSLRIAAALILFQPAAHSFDSRVMLPVTDGHGIQFTRLSVGGESFQSRVASITQDRFGLLWFGTDDGLYRYDGYNLKSYRRERRNPNSLSDDTVTVVYVDRAGILWVGTGFGGLNRLDPVSDVFTQYHHDPANRGSLSDNAVRSIYQDAGGALWVGTGAGGLDRLDPGSQTFVHYVNNPRDSGSLSSNSVTDIFEDRRGSLWVGSIGGGLNLLDRRTSRFTRFLHNPEEPRSPGDDSDESLSRIRQDRSGALWLGFALSTLDATTGSFTRYAFRSKESGPDVLGQVRAIQEDRDGVLWLGTVSGLLALDRERKQFVRYNRNPANPHSLHNDDVLALFQDAEGNMWVGTQSGVSRFNRRSRFINRQYEAGDKQSLADNTVRAVHVDSQGNLWVGTRRGLQRFDRKTGRSTHYQHDPRDPYSLSNNFVTVIREDRSGTLWVGTGGGGLDRFDRTTGRFFAYRYQPHKRDGLSSDAVLSLLEDRDGTFWIATAAGLNRLDRRTGRFTTYLHDPGNPHSLSDDVIKTVFEDRMGNLWVGSKGGLNRFDRASQQFTVWRHNALDLASLSHDQVNAIWEDRAGALWIATQDGLNQMDRNRGTFTTYTRRDGLPDNAVQAILEDDHGALWLATHNGLSQFRPLTRTFRNYSESDGLPGNLFNPTGTEGSCRAPDGEMWFGSRSGLTSFFPDRVSGNPYVPPVVLTDLLLFNIPVHPGKNSPLHQPIWAQDSLTLNPRQGIFTLEFAALSYVAPDKNRYRYRLEGLETDWNQVDSRQRRATYTSLPPAEYLFRVQASNNGDVWNDKGVALPITILPPWWATLWFRSIVVVSLACLAFGVYRSRLKREMHLQELVERRTAELVEARDHAQAADHAKSAFLANMSHELRTPLNAILGFSTLLSESEGISGEQRKDLEIINRSGHHLLGLINDVLDVAKVEAGRIAVEVASCDVHSLVRDVTEMMQVRARERNLRLLVEESPCFPRFIRTDASKLRQILINLIGNSVKYSETGTIVLRLAGLVEGSGRTLLRFEVEDTGIGIAAEDQARIFEPFVRVGNAGAQDGTGLGLAIVRKYVEMMSGNILVKSAPGRGSRFSVELPVEQEEESEAMVPPDNRPRVVGIEPADGDYRVLIVEDQFENRLFLQRVLERVGFQVRVAENGEKGIEIFEAWRPQFIWMDRGLRGSGIDGLETVRRIRELEGGREVKIAAVTASVLAGQRDEMLTAGLDDFLAKPFHLSEIFDCMALHLGVRYVRAEPLSRQVAEAQADLRPEAFAAIPTELREDLVMALLSLDNSRIAQLIRRISELDAALGGVLAVLAARLTYTPILKALRAVPCP